MKSKIESQFRLDINGLRAWAVLLVILYHFGIPGFSGGFIGVDTFFVISGYLMTGIVIRGLEENTDDTKNKFSLIAFYAARTRRIFPALIILCLILIIAGWFLLLQNDYKILATQSVASLTFLSNFNFWRQAGYFDPSSHEKWLLHTWSLSVEWQFYLILPMLLLSLWKLVPNRLGITFAISVGFAVSLATSILLSKTNPTASFFLLHTRAWEMFAGGLVYLLAAWIPTKEIYKTSVEILGFSLITLSLVIFDPSTVWPGWQATIPVLGTSLILFARRNNSLLTGNTIAQWLGTRSYSLYLWHWPITVGLVYSGQETAPIAVITGLFATFILGHLSFTLIENPSQKYLAKLSNPYCIILVFAIALSAILFAGFIYTKNGIKNRFPSHIEAIAAEASNFNPRRKECMQTSGSDLISCVHGGNNIRAILIGDSHGNAIVSSIANALSSPQDGILEITYSGCPTMFGVQPTRAHIAGSNFKCSEFLEKLAIKIKELPEEIPLIIANRSSAYLLGFNETLKDKTTRDLPLVSFNSQNLETSAEFAVDFSKNLVQSACRLAESRKTYMLQPVPEMGQDVPKSARSMIWGIDKDISISISNYQSRNTTVLNAQKQAHEQCEIELLDPTPYLCWDGKCHGLRNGRALYFDDDHLSEFGNKLLTPMFRRVFGDVLSPTSNSSSRSTE